MSEYQRYEFMTCDRPLTRAQLDAVNRLSSHIEATATYAVIEYNWGDFKYDPIKVLHKYFDGFLYWANWGSPQLAFRFPHGVLPLDLGALINDYDLEEFVAFTQHSDYDILDIHFHEMEPPDQWMEYNLGSLIGIREELMEGDLRPIYIVWLAAQDMFGNDQEEEGDDYYDGIAVPPGMGALTEAQKALAELFQVPDDVLTAAAQYSQAAPPPPTDDFAAWIALLPQARRDEYLLRLARNEPGLSSLLVRELRELGRGKPTRPPAEGKHITYARLAAESKDIEARRLREERERARMAHLRRLQEVHDHRETYWRQVEKDTSRATSAGYDDAVKLLSELREAAEEFNGTPEFQGRFHTWVQSLQRRPGLLRRLRERNFIMPE